MSLVVWKEMQGGEVSIIAGVLIASQEEVREVMVEGGDRQIVPKGCVEIRGRCGTGSSRERCCLVMGCSRRCCSQSFLG